MACPDPPVSDPNDLLTHDGSPGVFPDYLVFLQQFGVWDVPPNPNPTIWQSLVEAMRRIEQATRAQEEQP